MKNSIKVLGTVITLSLITLSWSCASSPRLLPPVLELRTLEVHPDLPGVFYYPTEVEFCAKKILGICVDKDTKISLEIFDTNDPEVRKLLVGKDFVLKVRQKP